MRPLPSAAVRTIVAALALSTGGCAILGWTVASFTPAPDVPAVYKPPKGKTLLVYVDDRNDPVPHVQVKSRLAREICARLEQRKVVADTVPYPALLRLESSRRDFHGLTPRQVGEALGAELVLHVRITRFSLKDDPVNPFYHGRLGARVSMLSVAEGLLWPQDQPSGAAVPPVETEEEEGDSRTYVSEVCNELAGEMGTRIAQLFYKHKGKDPLDFEDQ